MNFLLLIKNQVLTVAISADANEQTLRGYADRIRNGMLSYVPKKPDNWLDKFISSFSGEAGVSQVELTGIRPYEISIELSEDAMNAYIDLRRSQGRRPFIDGPHFEVM